MCIRDRVILAFVFANHFNIVGMGKDFSQNLGVPYDLVLFMGLTIAATVSYTHLLCQTPGDYRDFTVFHGYVEQYAWRADPKISQMPCPCSVLAKHCKSRTFQPLTVHTRPPFPFTFCFLPPVNSGGTVGAVFRPV